MNEIDWSKAPEGADKYNMYNNLFYKGVQPDLQVFTRRQWRQSAFMKSDERFMCRPTTPSWSGEGLPPVGVVCEANFVGSWTEFEMRYYGESYVIFKTFYEVQRTRLDFDTCGVKFRPIRTPEQSAADEREAAIDAMLAATPAPGSDISLRVCEKLYDAGYRKP